MSWGVSDSLKVYNIEHWGIGYFNVNPHGNMTVHPLKEKGAGIDIPRVVNEIKSRGIALPVLLRFQDIIRDRVVTLNEAFKTSIQESGFKGRYQGVYPVKVNQMREVVEEIIDAGRPYNIGLEAGSKAELAAVLAMENSPESLNICNGYKDRGFLKTALMGVKLGKRMLIVIEKLTELTDIIEIARELNVKPLLGIRAKLYSKGSGKWESSGGEFAKFGLTTPELLHAVQTLRKEGMEDSFKLLHFHIGSQITNIRTIQDATKEATRLYAKFVQMGFPLEYLDIGGGLGVDYDGSRTDFDSSTNYTLTEFVAAVVYSIQEICQAEKVPEPNIVSESGRALVAHHSVLVVDVFGDIRIGSTPLGMEMEESENEASVVKEIRYVQRNLTNKKLLEHFHDAIQRKEEALAMFNLGILSLEDRAKVEYVFWQICHHIYKHTKDMKYVPEELETLNKQLADQYLCNFSVFQSMLDHWAIQHLFPIVPIHRLAEEPTRNGTLVDITCDSDGKVCKFTDLRDIRNTLPLHAIHPGESYQLGFFLMGAYQDIMGDLHNLFGRVNEVHVFLDETEPGGYYLEEVIPGSKISDVLSFTQYSTPYLAKRVKEMIDLKVRAGEMKPREGVELQAFYESLLDGYTYLNPRHVMNGEVKREGVTLNDRSLAATY